MSAICILEQNGTPIIQRNYKNDIPSSAIDTFINFLVKQDNYIKPPVFTKNGISFLHITHNNLYLLIITPQDDNAMMMVAFLKEVISVLEDYFNKLTEESLRKNFVLVYELLDEMMDFGYPQTTQAKVLKDYICINEKFRVKKTKPPSTVTNAVSWRSEGISHSKNEIFLDVIEKINLMVNQHGKVIQSEIVGVIKMKSFLSGMPELKLGLNDKLMVSKHTRTISPNKGVELDDIKFHQCVRLSRFESDRTISFIPPDGDFELMSYRLNTHIRPPFTVRVQTNYKPFHKIEHLINIKSEFKQVSCANNVKVVVPVPQDADSPSFETTAGSTNYDPTSNCFTWRLSQFAGSSSYELRARFGLPKIACDRGESAQLDAAHIKIMFEIPYYTVSGIQVRYLKIIEKSGYSALPWVRYAAREGDYLVRMPPLKP